MYFLCIAIWQLLVQQQSNMQNLAKSYPKNHIKDTCNTDSKMEKSLQGKFYRLWALQAQSVEGG